MEDVVCLEYRTPDCVEDEVLDYLGGLLGLPHLARVGLQSPMMPPCRINGDIRQRFADAVRRTAPEVFHMCFT